MKRKIILIILLVFTAAAINIAVALGFWFFGERPPAPSIDNDYGIVDLRQQELAVWRGRRDSDWPLDPSTATMHNYFGITRRSLIWIEIEWSEPIDDPASKVIKYDSYSIDIVELGWPVRWIAGEQWKELHGLATQQQFNTGLFQAFGYQWPNRVLWAGMFINVLFYCALIALTFLSWIYIPRANRRRRGRCLKCAYDLRGDYSSGCPECGYGRELA
ncbi:MAG: hypothetical protein IH984_05360 [Planctomycetes bacterium]|nr:hypothetical protein [Planctomycetota bacterium]